MINSRKEFISIQNKMFVVKLLSCAFRCSFLSLTPTLRNRRLNSRPRQFGCQLYGVVLISACAFAIINFGGSHVIHIPCVLGISLGLLLVFGTLIGFWGALRESLRLTWLFTIILSLLLAAQITVNILLPIDYNQFAREVIESAWKQMVHNSEEMESYEKQYECCGKRGFEDYMLSGLPIPFTCYKHKYNFNTTELYKTGCVTKLEEAFSMGSLIEEISEWSLVGLEAITLILALMFGISLLNKKRRARY